MSEPFTSTEWSQDATATNLVSCATLQVTAVDSCLARKVVMDQATVQEVARYVAPMIGRLSLQVAL